MKDNELFYGKEAKRELKAFAEGVLHEMQDELMNELSVPALMDGNQRVAIRLSELQGAKKFLEKLMDGLMKEETADE